VQEGAASAPFAALHGLYWLCVNLSDRGPLVLAVDDLQWADAASLRWVSFLARRIEGLPVLLVATLREEGTAGRDAGADDLVVNRVAKTIRPAALSVEAVGLLVRRELGGEAHPAFVAACQEATRGNPLFLRELLGALRQQGVAPIEAQAPRVGEVGPRAVTRFVLARLAALGPDAERLARVAALLGDGADADLVRRTAELDPAAFADAAHRLAGADLVTVEPRVSFVHPVSRAAIVAALEPRRARGPCRAAPRRCSPSAATSRASPATARGPARGVTPRPWRPCARREPGRSRAAPPRRPWPCCSARWSSRRRPPRRPRCCTSWAWPSCARGRASPRSTCAPRSISRRPARHAPGSPTTSPAPCTASTAPRRASPSRWRR
jgi:hypothetical protein